MFILLFLCMRNKTKNKNIIITSIFDIVGRIFLKKYLRLTVILNPKLIEL